MLADRLRRARKRSRSAQRVPLLVGRRIARDGELLTVESHDRDTCTVVTVGPESGRRSWNEAEFLSAVCEILP